MRVTIARTFLVILFSFIVTIGSQGQTTVNDAEIKQLRSDIKLLAEHPPQTESSLSGYHETLLDLRLKLNALLNQQVGALKRDIRELSASASLQSYVKGLDNESKALENEIRLLATELVQTNAPPKPAESPTTPLPQIKLPRDAQGKKYGDPGFQGDFVSLNLVNASLQDLLDYLHDQYDVTFLIDPSVPSPVIFSYKAQQVPWNSALDAILKPQGLGAKTLGERLKVAAVEVLDKETQTEKFMADAAAKEAKLRAEARAKEAQSKSNFDAEVKSFSTERLAAAAAPASLMTDQIQPNCKTVLANFDQYPKYDQALCGLAKAIKGRLADGQRAALELGEDKGALLTILIAKLLRVKGTESLVAFVTEAQEARTDQQVGAGPSSSGTTSLVSKGGVPYLLGFAVENGAATESTSGTTATFRINPGGLINTLAKKGFITGFQETENDAVMKMLRKTSIGLTFDTSRGNNPGTFIGDRQQLSQFSVRYEFVNERDARNKKYLEEWDKLVRTAGEEFAATTWATTRALQSFEPSGRLSDLKDPALQAWLNKTNEKLVNTRPDMDEDALAAIIRSQADLIPVDEVSAETVEAVTTFAKGFQSYEDARNALLDKIAKGKVFTIEYTNTRGVNAPDLSNINFIAATGAGDRIDLTANGSFTFYNKLPAATALILKPGRIRDFQFAGQVLIPFKVGESQFDFWFSGRYERLMENASTVAGTIVPNTKGDIAVGQIGLNVPIKSLGIKFPVSVTFANRTELIKEKEIRGNVGFTFNWDTLFSKLKPF